MHCQRRLPDLDHPVKGLHDLGLIGHDHDDEHKQTDVPKDGNVGLYVSHLPSEANVKYLNCHGIFPVEGLNTALWWL